MAGSIMNVALPSLRADLTLDAGAAQWVVNAYLLPLGALALLGGGLGDRYGRKQTFLAGIGLFLAGVIVAALAPGHGILLAGRALQGVGAALFTPNSLALIANAYEGAARQKAVGAWAAIGALAGAAAPVVGGAAVDLAGWRWAFAVILAPGVAALLIGGAYLVRDPPRPRSTKLDVQGALIATLALGGLVWALIALPARGLFDPWVAGAAMTSLALAGAFVCVERKLGPAAMLPTALFSTRAFVGVSVLTFFLYGALGGAMLLLPYLLIEAYGFEATEAGAALTPFPLLLASLSRFAGRAAALCGAWPMLVAGPAIVAAGFVLIADLPAVEFDYWRDMLPGLVLVALGMAATVAPLTTTVLDAAPAQYVGAASGVNSAIARIAGLIATALIGFVLIAADSPSDLASNVSSAAYAGAGLAVFSALCAVALLPRKRPAAT